jgi:hypothetical protein
MMRALNSKTGDQKGFVLVMVMLVLVATIIVGIFLARTSFIETKIAGNEKIYKQNLYYTESIGDWSILNNSGALKALRTTVDGVYTYDPAGFPSDPMFDQAAVTVRLTAIRKPPIGSGTDPARFRSRYYDINASRQGQAVLVGVHKAFPKS